MSKMNEGKRKNRVGFSDTIGLQVSQHPSSPFPSQGGNPEPIHLRSATFLCWLHQRWLLSSHQSNWSCFPRVPSMSRYPLPAPALGRPNSPPYGGNSNGHSPGKNSLVDLCSMPVIVMQYIHTYTYSIYSIYLFIYLLGYLIQKTLFLGRPFIGTTRTTEVAIR